MRRTVLVMLATISAAGGCAHALKPPGPGVVGGAEVLRADPAPPADPKWLLALDDIPPRVALPPPRATSRPAEAAPVEALALFAAGRDQLLDGKPLAAIGLYERAIQLDPDSYELYRALGEAQLSRQHKPNPESLDAFEKALALRPDGLRLRTLLGAQYASTGQVDKALTHLRVAAQTEAYRRDDVAAAAVDLLLARMLQDQGYDRAALDRYLILIHRLNDASYALRSDPELGGLAAQPQVLWVEVGELCEKHGRWAEALAAYQPLAEADPSSFDLQSKVVRMLSAEGRRDEAVTKAADVVMRFRAGSDSVSLLKEVCRKHGRGVEVSDVLRRLHERHPDDKALLLALTDVLRDEGRAGEAETLLRPAAAAGPTDEDVFDKLFELYLARDDVQDAARLLVAHLAASPDSLGEVGPKWGELLRPLRTNSLRLSALQGLDVPPGAEAARLFLVSRLADLWRRDALSRSALELAVKVAPPFPPAWRELVVSDWAKADWDETQKQKASDDLADSARRQGNPELAEEVRGLAQLSDKKPEAAAQSFARALALGGSSPELRLTYAAALRADKDDAKAEQLLWKLVSDRPGYGEAWGALFRFYLDRHEGARARKVLSGWLAADPGSVDARVLQATVAAEDGNVGAAEAILLKAFADHGDNSDVIAALVGLYRRTGKIDQFIGKLEDERVHRPNNRTAVEWLVEIYADQGGTAAAARVLDETRSAVGNDPDLLYQLAPLYGRIDEKGTAEDVLQQVVALDPRHAAASNDLGYSWADEGKNLNKAEALIRVAVDAEPDNQSFLDSMGWVLYKRGKYADAAAYLEKAIGPAALPDPVVLDHYGDVLYRLGRPKEAARQWQRSLSRLDEQPADRDDLKRLRLELMRKLDEERHGKPAPVAK